MIKDSRLWNLYIALDTNLIDVMAYCPLEDHNLLSASLPFNPATPSSSVEAIEEVVYDNPLLLNDFNKVTIVSRYNTYCILPTPIASNPVMAADITTEMTGKGDDSATLTVDHLPLLDTSISHYIDNPTYNFLTRTFNGATFLHHLSVITRYCHGTHRSTGNLTSYVYVRDTSLDIILFRGDTLLLANTYEWHEPTDILYYIMATRRAHGIDNRAPVIVGTDPVLRDSLLPLLRQYIPTVMPAIFPAAMFRAGGNEAMNTPTDLILLPLCE
ncbi:MAG: DUF3822 family protein [Clostridiales bacterium]|nr:DUF3822 family protein [Clostridiales bacterium]